jgi:hypothetical protein
MRSKPWSSHESAAVFDVAARSGVDGELRYGAFLKVFASFTGVFALGLSRLHTEVLMKPAARTRYAKGSARKLLVTRAERFPCHASAMTWRARRVSSGHQLQVYSHHSE